IAVRAEDLSLAELGLQLREQRGHRRMHIPLVAGLVRGPVGLGVVGRQAFVELQRLGGPPVERHRSPDQLARDLDLPGHGTRQARPAGGASARPGRPGALIRSGPWSRAVPKSPENSGDRVKFAWLCSHESYQPEELVEQAVAAEEAGFDVV